MKLNNRRTILVGLAFLSICTFWQMYDSVMTLILTDTFKLNETFAGAIMAADNVLALFLLPFFGALSDKTSTRIGRRMPFIVGGTALAAILMNLIPLLDDRYAANPSTGTLVLFIIVLGLLLVSMGTYRSPAVALMPDVTPKPLRSRANAIINLMGAVGGILYLGLAALMYPVSKTKGVGHVSYRPLFFIVSMIMVAAVAILYLTIREPKLVEENRKLEAAHPEWNLATDDGRLNLAGVLLFAEQPDWIVPQFVVKAIRYPGNKIHVADYLDTEDFSGPLPKLFEGALAFVMRNLHKVQAGRGVNAPGTPEIPEAVFEELLVNALVHRDYLVSAPIRLFVFDNRIEIISPGHLPNNLTVEKIRAGNSNIRNPILVSYVAKGLLPYHGLGSGIKRALEKWPAIDFADDHDGCLFTATVHRKLVEELELADKGAIKVQGAPIKASLSGLQGQLLDFIRSNPSVSYDELAGMTQKDSTTVMRNIGRLKDAGILRRVGSKKTGHWEVME